MCTSFTVTTIEENQFLARTMDFGVELSGKPIIIPRNYEWSLSIGSKLKTKYGFVGTGRKADNYFVADGMNEKGVAIAELYFKDEAVYHDEARTNAINLAPHEFIMWILGEISSIQELEQRINEINLLNVETEFISTIVPLHFIVTDQSRRTIVIESNSGELKIKENPVCVMTNSPELEWHLKNLNNYLFLQPTNPFSKNWGNHTVKPFGQGAGTLGLPGGYTAPERFVRAVYHRFYTDFGSTLEENLHAIFLVLQNVTIPKGVVVQDNDVVDYTQYHAVFDIFNRNYYFTPYATQEVYSLHLDEELLNLDRPKEFDINQKFAVKSIEELDS